MVVTSGMSHRQQVGGEHWREAQTSGEGSARPHPAHLPLWGSEEMEKGEIQERNQRNRKTRTD